MPLGSIAFATRCSRGTIDPLFFQCWTRMLLDGSVRPGDEVLLPMREAPQGVAASALALQFLAQTRCDTLLFIDDDMTFNKEAIANLRESPDNDGYGVVGGLYCYTKPSNIPMLAVPSPRGFRMRHPEQDDGVVEVAFLGLGFTAIRRDTFERVKPRVPHLYFEFDGLNGEDITFCTLARKAGMKCGVDCRVRVGHRRAVEVIFDPRTGQAVQNDDVNGPLQELFAAVEEAR